MPINELKQCEIVQSVSHHAIPQDNCLLCPFKTTFILFIVHRVNNKQYCHCMYILFAFKCSSWFGESVVSCTRDHNWPRSSNPCSASGFPPRNNIINVKRIFSHMPMNIGSCKRSLKLLLSRVIYFYQ